MVAPIFTQHASVSDSTSPAADPGSPSAEESPKRKPASQRKLDANRRNAARSTGPRTEAGKERASRNAVTHGLFCTGTGRAFYIPPGEDREQFLLFERAMVRSLRPLDFVQRELALQAARMAWKLRARLPRAEEVHWHAALGEEKEEWASVVQYETVYGKAAQRQAEKDVEAAAKKDPKGDDPAAAQARADREFRNRMDRAARRGDRVAATMPDELVAPGVVARACAQVAVGPVYDETDREGDPTPTAKLGRLERYEMQLRRELQSIIRTLTMLQKLQGMAEEEEEEGAEGPIPDATAAQNEPTAEQAVGDGEGEEAASDEETASEESDGVAAAETEANTEEDGAARNEADPLVEPAASDEGGGVAPVEPPAAMEAERVPAQNEPTAAPDAPAAPVAPLRHPSLRPRW
jgi:hypothetical protein